jgi:hypothetical protein
MVAGGAMGDVTDRTGAGPARILSFETFVRRSVGAAERPDQSRAPESPFIVPGWLRPLNARQILHRQAMLRNFQRQG